MKEYLQKRLYDLINKLDNIIGEVDTDARHEFNTEKLKHGLKKIEEGINDVNNAIERFDSY